MLTHSSLAVWDGAAETVTWSSASWDALEQLGSPHIYPASIVIFEQDTEPYAVYLIEEGVVKLSRSEENRQTVVGLRFRGSLLGATAAVTRGRYFAVTAETATRCTLRRIDVRAFRCLVDADPHLAQDTMRLFAEELDELMLQVAVGPLLARHRLERLLYTLAPLCGMVSNTGLRLRLPIRHFELAQAIMVSPQYLSRLLKSLEVETLILRDGGWLILRDPDLLWHGNVQSTPNVRPPRWAPQESDQTVRRSLVR